MSDLHIRGQRERWQTPVCDYPWLIFLELRNCNGELEIEVYYYADDQSQCFRFIWEEYDAYRSTDATEYLPWDNNTPESESQKTHKILKSQWVKEFLKDRDQAYEIPNPQHFVLCTSDYIIEVLSEFEPLIQQWTVASEKPPTNAKAQHELVLPEPKIFYSANDEANFFNTLKSIPEVTNVTGVARRTKTSPNTVVLSLSCRFLRNDSLRTVLGLLTRYKLPMASLAGQHGPHNADWFKNPKSYWYKSVF